MKVSEQKDWLLAQVGLKDWSLETAKDKFNDEHNKDKTQGKGLRKDAYSWATTGKQPEKKDRKPRSPSAAFNASKSIDDIKKEFSSKLDALKTKLEAQTKDDGKESLLSMPIPKLIQKAMDFQAKQAQEGQETASASDS
jgi:hypothetical protein